MQFLLHIKVKTPNRTAQLCKQNQNKVNCERRFTFLSNTKPKILKFDHEVHYYKRKEKRNMNKGIKNIQKHRQSYEHQKDNELMYASTLNINSFKV